MSRLQGTSLLEWPARDQDHPEISEDATVYVVLQFGGWRAEALDVAIGSDAGFR